MRTHRLSQVVVGLNDTLLEPTPLSLSNASLLSFMPLRWLRGTQVLSLPEEGEDLSLLDLKCLHLGDGGR